MNEEAVRLLKEELQNHPHEEDVDEEGSWEGGTKTNAITTDEKINGESGANRISISVGILTSIVLSLCLRL